MASLKDNFTQRLRVHRTEKGLNQENVATQLNLSVNSSSRIERGETEVTISRAEEFANVLEVDVAELLMLNQQNTFIQNGGAGSGIISQSTLKSNPDDSLMKDILHRLTALEQRKG